MILYKSLLVTIVLLASLSVSACGGGGTANDTTAGTSPAVATFQTFNFTATVDQILGTPPFSAGIGDKLNGKFVYDSSAKDWNVTDSNQGWFHDMSSPSGIQFQLGSLNFTSALDTYYILIQNDDSSVLPVRDEFEIMATSSQDSKLSTIFSLQDLTAAAFSSSSCNYLPQTLNINSFTNGSMFINTSTWNIRLHIDTITKQ